MRVDPNVKHKNRGMLRNDDGSIQLFHGQVSTVDATYALVSVDGESYSGYVSRTAIDDQTWRVLLRVPLSHSVMVRLLRSRSRQFAVASNDAFNSELSRCRKVDSWHLGCRVAKVFSSTLPLFITRKLSTGATILCRAVVLPKWACLLRGGATTCATMTA